MILLATAAGTVHNISNAPVGADAAYLADTMHVRPVVTWSTLADALAEATALEAALAAAEDTTTRALLNQELGGVQAEATAITTALQAAHRGERLTVRTQA